MLMLATACAGHPKEKKEKWVYFDVTVSGQSDGLLPENTVVNTTGLLADGRDYQRPLVNGHAEFFANAKVGARSFLLDLSDSKVQSSLISKIVFDWKTLPPVQVNGCKLGYADLVTAISKDKNLEYRLAGKVSDSTVTGNDCAGKLIGDIVFSLQGNSPKNTVVCKVKDLPNSFTTELTSSGKSGVTNAKPRKRLYLCSATLWDGSSVISPSRTTQYGYDFAIQAYHVTDFDIATWDEFTGYLVYIDENGNATPVLPHNFPPLPTVPFTTVTLDVRGYSGLNDPLAAYCDFNGLWTPVPMSQSYAAGTTIVVSQSVTFANVATDKQYACNFKNLVTGQWIYFPPPSTASNNYIFEANGIQVIDPNGNNLKIQLDGAGQMVVPLYTVTFTADPLNLISPEVNLILGYAGIYKSYPMHQEGNRWVTTLSISHGDWEGNVMYDGGAYQWLTEIGEAGSFYVADISGGMSLPGVRMDQNVNAIMYASEVSGPPPTYVISHSKNYSWRHDYSGINGMNYTVTTIGIIIATAPAIIGIP